MNIEDRKRLIELHQAVLDGKSIEHRSLDSQPWLNMREPVFNDQLDRYRIKPTPKLIPWTMATCPVGAQVKHHGLKAGIHLITTARIDSALVGTTWISYNSFVPNYYWKFPQETEWKPCGTLEVVS